MNVQKSVFCNPFLESDREKACHLTSIPRVLDRYSEFGKYNATELLPAGLSKSAGNFGLC